MNHPSIRTITRASATTHIDPASTALIAIDFQNEYFEGRMPIPDGMAAMRQAKRLVELADTHRMPVVHVQHLAPVDSPIFAEGGKLFDIHPDMAPAPHHVVLRKPTPSAFAGTDLHAQLQVRGIKTLILTGLMTHMCVSATAFGAAALGYQTIIVSDACATRDLDLEEGGVLSHRDLHRAALRGVSDVVAEVRTAAQVRDLPIRA
jgi:nicotinamidase-related amidase